MALASSLTSYEFGAGSRTLAPVPVGTASGVQRARRPTDRQLAGGCPPGARVWESGGRLSARGALTVPPAPCGSVSAARSCRPLAVGAALGRSSPGTRFGVEACSPVLPAGLSRRGFLGFRGSSRMSWQV